MHQAPISGQIDENFLPLYGNLSQPDTQLCVVNDGCIDVSRLLARIRPKTRLRFPKLGPEQPGLPNARMFPEPVRLIAQAS